MTVRQIPRSRRSITGLFPSLKNGKMVPFESTLERDLCQLLEFDDAVIGYEAQPVIVEYRRPSGRRCQGVPDYLIFHEPTTGRPPELCDVKYRSDLFAHWPELKSRLKAARRHAIEQGWSYKIRTEVEIRTDRLRNAVFLYRFLSNGPPDPKHARILLECLRRLSGSSPATLLAACHPGVERALALPALWYLIASRRAAADLDVPLTMDSQICDSDQ